MEVRYLMKLFALLTYQHVADSAWTLTGSSNVGMVGEQFTLTCTPSGTFDIVTWRRNGVVIAGITKSCTRLAGTDPKYTYTCGLVFNLTIPASSMTSDQHNTNWTCMDVVFGGRADYILQVYTPVSSITIQQLDTGYPGVNIVYENVAKTFKYVTNPCNPKASVTVTHTVSGDSIQINDETSSPVNGLYVTSRIFTVIATRDDQGKTVTCTAENIQGRQPATQTITLDVYHTPTITLDITAIVVEEGSSFNRACSATGYPTPVVKWYRGNIELASGTGTLSSLSYSDIDRSITGTYTCRATAVKSPYRTLQSEASVLVTVQYPPTAQVIVPIDVTENDRNVAIVCAITNGVPEINTIHGWSQSVRGTLIRSGLRGTAIGNDNKLVFPSASFEDNGDYKCEVGNGVKGKQPTIIQSATAYFNIKVSAKFNVNDRLKAAEQNKVVNISFPVYSNPLTLVNNIRWTNESSGVVLTQSNSLSFNLINAYVEKQIHGKTVLLDGQIASITFKPFLRYYVGNYTIAVTNGGTLTSSFSFQIGASGPPNKPVNFEVYNNTTSNSITLTWISGFNGGHKQTFVIRYEYSGIIKEKNIEENPSRTNYSYTVNELYPATKYQFWLYAKNQKGKSSLFSETPLEEVTAEAASPSAISNAGPVAGGVVGALVVVIVITAIVIGIIIYRRRHVPSESNLSNSNVKSTQEYADLQPTRDNNLYDRCNDTTNRHVYENQSPATTAHRIDNVHNIGESSTYEEVAMRNDANYDNSASQENKYERLRRASERDAYEGIKLPDTGPVDKVYYVNTELQS